MDTKPSTFYHSPAVQEINQKIRSKNLGAAICFDFSEEALIAEARKETGLHDLGDESFLPAMRMLLKSVQEEANLNPFGQFVIRARAVRSLKNKLWAEACFKAHPEILERKVKAPVIIVGPHRSGTTRLQHVLAIDARLQHLRAWEGMNPAARLGHTEFGKAERYEEAKKSFSSLPAIFPGAYTAHPMEADWPEEEMLLLNQSFCGFLPLGECYAPSYYKWFLTADKTHAYAAMANLMRLLSWERGEPEGKRWILKNPQHLLDLDILLKVFPDAKLIFTHRDPIKTVGSVMSLMWYYAVQNTDLPCRAKVRDIWMDFCVQMARRGIEARKNIPASQQMDVHYEEMNRDWRSVMRRIYEFAEMEITPEVEQAMDGWLTKSGEENRHGQHRYSLEDFGITEDEVDSRMMFVRENYSIPYEKSRTPIAA